MVADRIEVFESKIEDLKKVNESEGLAAKEKAENRKKLCVLEGKRCVHETEQLRLKYIHEDGKKRLKQLLPAPPAAAPPASAGTAADLQIGHYHTELVVRYRIKIVIDQMRVRVVFYRFKYHFAEIAVATLVGGSSKLESITH